MMKSYVFCLVCLMCLGVKSQSAPDPPIYPNTTISKFTVLFFFSLKNFVFLSLFFSKKLFSSLFI